MRKKIRVFEPVKQLTYTDGETYLLKLTDVRDADDHELKDVFGVGETPNEAARNAFKHAADLMFPPKEP